MKTFKDLKFNPHPVIPDGTQAIMKFADDTVISVITGSGSYSGYGSYEMFSSRAKGDGIRGYITPKQINAHMRYIQQNLLKSKPC
jgi:hypothetical protein